MVDFAKQVARQSAPKEVDPIQLYEGLDRRSDTGPLRPAQDFVLREWHSNHRGATDGIIKLHTGQGKTIVGLLVLLSKLNEGAGPCLYLSPNRFLADQTCAQAERFGIPVLNGNQSSDLPLDFTQGRKIYVATVQKLFNGLTKFGLRAREALDNPGVDPRLISKSLAASRMLRVLVEVFQSFPRAGRFQRR